MFGAAMTCPSPFFTPSTSVRKTNSLDCRATATATAVSSPFTLSSVESPRASVGITGSQPPSNIVLRAAASARTSVPTKPHGPDFFEARIAPNIPTAGSPFRRNAPTSAGCTSPSSAMATAPRAWSSVTRNPSMNVEVIFIRSSTRVI